MATRSDDKKERGFSDIAIYHLSAKIVKRSTGRSSVAAAAYRAGCELFDDRTGQSHDYSKKRDVVYSQIIAPEGSPDWVYDRAKLWNTVEKSETRKDAQTAREIEIALPIELTPDQRNDLVREFVTTEFVSKGMIADVAIHNPHVVDRQENPHAHILLTTRELEGQEFSKKKNREWNSKDKLVTWRSKWAELSNAALKKNGHDITIDHRTLDAQNIAAIARGDEKTAQETDRKPTKKMGKKATAMERRGVKTARGNRNRNIKRRNRFNGKRPKSFSRMLQNHITKWAELDAYGAVDPGVAILMRLQQQQIDFAVKLLIDAPLKAATKVISAGVNLARSKIEASKRIALDVPFAQKEAAKKAGAKWNRENKYWYAPDKDNLGDLKQWVEKPEEKAAKAKTEFEKAQDLRLAGARAKAKREFELAQAKRKEKATNDLKTVQRQRVELDVPFQDKEAAKEAGAVWYPDKKKWYAPDKDNLGDLKQWVVKPEPVQEPPPKKTKRQMLNERLYRARIAFEKKQAFEKEALAKEQAKEKSQSNDQAMDRDDFGI